jgi:WD40 repeat protein
MKYPEIFDFSKIEEWKEKYLTKEVLSKEWDLMTQEILPDVIEVPFFTEEFCDKFIENIKDVQYHQSDRWGTPTNVVSIDSLGLKDLIMDLVVEYLHPITYHYWMVDGKNKPTITFSNSTQHHDSAISVLKWNPFGKRLISGDKKGQICIWSVDPRGTTNYSIFMLTFFKERM